MIISLCSSLFDYAGVFVVEADNLDSEFSHVGRRVSRLPTLDGGAVITDNGYTASDATFNIVLKNIDNQTRLNIIAMIVRHSLLTIAVKDNVFAGVVELADDKDALKIRFLVSQQLNQV